MVIPRKPGSIIDAHSFLKQPPCGSTSVINQNQCTLNTSCIHHCTRCWQCESRLGVALLLNSVGTSSEISLLISEAEHLKHFSSTMDTTDLSALMTRPESVHKSALTYITLIKLGFHIYVVNICRRHENDAQKSSGELPSIRGIMRITVPKSYVS